MNKEEKRNRFNEIPEEEFLKILEAGRRAARHQHKTIEKLLDESPFFVRETRETPSEEPDPMTELPRRENGIFSEKLHKKLEIDEKERHPEWSELEIRLKVNGALKEESDRLMQKIANAIEGGASDVSEN